MKYTINIALCRYTCEPIRFKLGMMLDTTKLFSWIPLRMTLIFNQDHRVARKLELVRYFCCKVT